MLPSVGIGLRSRHLDDLAKAAIQPVFLEVHAENYLRPSPAVDRVLRLRNDFEVSVHAVGLSLGSVDGIDEEHLERLARLVERLQPALISEHLSWNRLGRLCFNDLLPLPYTEQALEVVAANVGRLQDRLGRQVAIENPSRYLAFAASTLTEAEFLDELVRRSGCGLLDINNIVVTAHNLELDPADWLNELPGEAIAQYHLAGHAVNLVEDGSTVLVDDHGSPVGDQVWRLFDEALTRFGPRPTLIEWDTDVPPLATLLAEAARADRALARADQADVALAA
jgi:uncharacterized protein (UPF0276 family)